MNIANDTLKCYREDTYTFKVTVTNEIDGSVFNLTGYTATFTAKQGDTIKITKSILCDDAPETGIFDMILSSDITNVNPASYEYDVQIKNSDDPPIIKTVGRGRIIILKDITRG